MEFCLAIKNNEMMSFVGKWIQPENTGLSKTGQTGERQIIFSYLWILGFHIET